MADGHGSVSVVAQDNRESWQTDAPGPFMTIRAGGPLDGIVTLTAIADGHGRTLVEARWTQDRHVRRNGALDRQRAA